LVLPVGFTSTRLAEAPTLQRKQQQQQQQQQFSLSLQRKETCFLSFALTFFPIAFGWPRMSVTSVRSSTILHRRTPPAQQSNTDDDEADNDGEEADNDDDDDGDASDELEEAVAVVEPFSTVAESRMMVLDWACLSRAKAADPFGAPFTKRPQKGLR